MTSVGSKCQKIQLELCNSVFLCRMALNELNTTIWVTGSSADKHFKVPPNVSTIQKYTYSSILDSKLTRFTSTFIKNFLQVVKFFLYCISLVEFFILFRRVGYSDFQIWLISLFSASNIILILKSLRKVQKIKKKTAEDGLK